MELVKVKVEKKNKKDLSKSLEIILFNDDVNTFDYVINKLVTICGQTLEQAEQCTYIVHYSGKCSVKRGTFNELKPICLKLLDAGLTAEIL
tara:strand:- start:289 stop:561 length:273 start_codon:yes stop_codon:yes gene_type:complete